MSTEDVIREAGRQLLTVVFNYTEADGTNEGAREVEPYSYRDRNGRKFFGYDVRKQAIRAFVPANIRDIILTDNKFTPRWPVEV